MSDWLQSRKWVLLGLFLAGIGLVVCPPFLPTYVVILFAQSLTYAIAAMSLDLLIGYTGLGALGHIAYFAVGAYTTAILASRYQASFAGTTFFSIILAAGASALQPSETLREQ